MSIARKILMGAAGAGSKTTYVDDVFSTYVYRGTGAAQTITNGIDLAGEGGLVWAKGRNVGYYNILQDNVSGLTGTTNYLTSNENHIANANSNQITAFNNNGFDLGNQAPVNFNTYDFTSWTFRRQKGFFDIVSWTGNGSNRTIAHNLGSVPGCIMVKCTSETGRDWTIFHQGIAPVDPASYRLRLNTSDGRQGNAGYFNSTEPTSTHFSLGSNSDTNANGQSYVAYVFAGGQSTAANARSVYFNGGASLSLADTTDLEPGSGDFTIEAWVKPNADATSYDYLWSNGWGQQISWYQSNSGEMKFRAWFNDAEDSNYNVTLSSRGACAPREAWNHVAVVRNGNIWTLYVNGISESTVTASFTVSSNSDLPTIGRFDGSGSNSYHMKGSVSNFRFTKGQALYTSNFKPSIEPLTTTSQGAQAGNVKLLCCNGSTPTSSTVTPGTITNNSGVATRINNPFDDPEGYKFGEEGDQNIIKCGSYAGNSATDPYAPIIDLGWEPQYLLIKNAETSNTPWQVWDSIRGVVTGGNDVYLRPDSADAESSYERISFHPTGFRIDANSSYVNENEKEFIYIAIRRPDGYVGKPAEVGTDVFAMDTQIANGYPMYISNFVVDYALHRDPTHSGTWEGDWFSVSRLQGPDTLITNGTGTEQSGSWQHWDYNNGFGENGSASYTDWQAWMWKRHVGFDVVTYTGNATAGRQVPHSLNKTIEMMWVKRRNSARSWNVYHKGLNGGSSPEDYILKLDTTDAEANDDVWNDQAPTSTHFVVGNSQSTNGNGDNYIAMLFASVDGISKVGYYTGDGSSSMNIECGFSPRFVIMKKTDSTGNWIIYDTVRGWTGDSTDKYLRLNEADAQVSYVWGSGPYSTGFNTATWISTGDKVIYYAHA